VGTASTMEEEMGVTAAATAARAVRERAALVSKRESRIQFAVQLAAGSRRQATRQWQLIRLCICGRAVSPPPLPPPPSLLLNVWLRTCASDCRRTADKALIRAGRHALNCGPLVAPSHKHTNRLPRRRIVLTEHGNGRDAGPNK
jgi:hypothetical protein